MHDRNNRRAVPHAAVRPRALAMALVAGLAVTGADVALAAPQDAELIAGDYRLVQRGNRTFIHAADGTILRFSSFDIALNEFVRFIQPNARARVLARVQSSDPTRINGTLLANGQVYLTNPAGVIFGGGSVVNVGTLFAAAGHISNQDFNRGRDRFTDLSGPVINHGRITASGVALLGNYAANHGSIRSGAGFAVITAGEEVLIGDQLGSLFVRVQEADAQDIARAAAFDTAAPHAPLAAGDEFALAAWSTGRVEAGTVHIEGAGGATAVSGVVRSVSEARGGTVRVLGDSITITDATIDASGSLGGGDIVVGGGPLGSGPYRKSTATTIDAESTITADAYRAGRGGSITVYSTGETDFRGTATATTAAKHAEGGVIEVSGNDLRLGGAFDLRNTRGDFGSLVLDPTRLEIVPGSGTNTSTPALNRIFESFLENNANGNIVLFADVAITALADNMGTGYTDGVLDIGAGRSLSLMTRNNADLGDVAGGIDLRAIPLLRVGGDLLIETGSSSFVGNAGAFTAAAAGIDLGVTEVGGTSVRVDASRTGSVQLREGLLAGNADVQLLALDNIGLGGSLTGRSATFDAGDRISSNTTGTISVDALLTLAADDTIVLTGDVNAGDIIANAGVQFINNAGLHADGDIRVDAGSFLDINGETTADRIFLNSSDFLRVLDSITVDRLADLTAAGNTVFAPNGSLSVTGGTARVDSGGLLVLLPAFPGLDAASVDASQRVNLNADAGVMAFAGTRIESGVDTLITTAGDAMLSGDIIAGRDVFAALSNAGTELLIDTTGSVTAGRDAILDANAGDRALVFGDVTADRNAFIESARLVDIASSVRGDTVTINAGGLVRLRNGSRLTSRFDDPATTPGGSVLPRTIVTAPTILLGDGFSGADRGFGEVVTIDGGASFRGNVGVDAFGLTLRNETGGTLEFFGNTFANIAQAFFTLESAQDARLVFDPADPASIPAVLLPFLFAGDIGVDGSGANAGFGRLQFRSTAMGAPQPLLSSIILAGFASPDGARSAQGLLDPSATGRDFRILADEFVMGEGQRLLAFGDLTLAGLAGAAASSMTLGDLNVVSAGGLDGNLTISSLALNIVSRPAGPLEDLDAEIMRAMGLDPALMIDEGTDWVISGTFNFTDAAPAASDDLRLATSTGSSGGASAIGGLPINQWDTAALTLDSALRSSGFAPIAGQLYPFDLSAVGFSPVDPEPPIDNTAPDALATVFAGDEGGTDLNGVELARGDAELLRSELALNPLATPDAAVYLTGSLHLDRAPAGVPEADDAPEATQTLTLIRVAGPRLEATLRALRDLTGRTTSEDPADEALLERRQQALKTAFERYPADQDPAAFRAWVARRGDRVSVDALAMLDSLQSTIDAVEKLGLTELEKGPALRTLAERRAAPAAPATDASRFYQALGFPAAIAQAPAATTPAQLTINLP